MIKSYLYSSKIVNSKNLFLNNQNFIKIPYNFKNIKESLIKWDHNFNNQNNS